ncbi:MAG: OPT/YSL family transporter [Lentisphaeria bacterium]|nr:OPT/YSL family transporter [Lentisphaeria bacterium]
MADKKQKVDKELEDFRNIMDVPNSFEEGFTWSSFSGALFIALVMVPGALYMGLVAGEAVVGPAAQWVTIILFIEVAKRAHKQLKTAEIALLYFMASWAMAMPFSGLLWNQYYIQSEAAIGAGIAEGIPFWWAPDPSSSSYASRSFFTLDWLPVIGLVVFTAFFGQLKGLILGYGLFKVASDYEKLPFPMAPMQAMGITALAEDADTSAAENSEKSWRWRAFSIGGAIGLVWGAIFLLLPTLSGALTGTSIQIFEIPFTDLTPTTGSYLPAVATGIDWDLHNFVIGMVLPFWAVVGSFVGLMVTFILNPILYDNGTLHSWQEGENTIRTMFVNQMDFYFSFGIGIALAVFAAGLWQMFASIKRSRNKVKLQMEGVPKGLDIPKGRGDIPNWLIIAVYIVVTSIYVVVCAWLVDWHEGVIWAMILLGFVVTPMISYVTARLEGIAGQVVEIPYVREIALITSGYNGVAVWFLPIPIANYGVMTVFYRQFELLGLKFTSVWKAKFFLFPIILVFSIVFANFIWGLEEIPSSIYPHANVMWEQQALNLSIIHSSTLGEYSQFEEALNWEYISWGGGIGAILFALLTRLGAPVFLVYGVVRGLGQSMPHGLILQFVGAIVGRMYFKKKFGKMWLKYVMVVSTGFICGQGLISALGVGIVFLSKSVVKMPF